MWITADCHGVKTRGAEMKSIPAIERDVNMFLERTSAARLREALVSVRAPHTASGTSRNKAGVGSDVTSGR
jgi:hypothetical protein